MDILEGHERAEMSWSYQKEAPHAPAMRQLFEERAEAWWGYEEMADLLRLRGLDGLNPLLDEAEHRELFSAQDINTIVELIVRGLDRAA